MAGKPRGEGEWRAALRVALLAIDEDGKAKMHRLARVVVEAALAGEPWAVTEIGNRVDGRPAQAITIESDGGAILALPPADWAAAVDRRIEAARQEDVRVLLDATQGVAETVESVDESGYNGA